jgi:hypothetical protein
MAGTAAAPAARYRNRLRRESFHFEPPDERRRNDERGQTSTVPAFTLSQARLPKLRCNSHRAPRIAAADGQFPWHRRAFAATRKAVLSTKELLPWAFARAQGTGHNKRRSIRRVCERYCERVGRDTSIGRPILWRLRNTVEK